MTSGPLQILIPFLGVVINVITQILSFRYILRSDLLKSIFLGFFIGFCSVCVFEFYIFLNTTLSVSSVFFYIIIANIIIYISFELYYFNFISLSETARRIRILRELYDSRDGLSLEEILIRYNAKEIIERRINRLINKGQIILKDGKYYIGSPLMLLIAKIIMIVKHILLGKRAEPDYI